MPRVKIGDRGDAFLGALLDVVQNRQASDKSDQDEMRKWRQRMTEIGYARGLVDYNPMTGQTSTRAPQPELTPEDLRRQNPNASVTTHLATGPRGTTRSYSLTNPRPEDPVTRANRIAQLQEHLSRLQILNRANESGERADYLKQYPNPNFGFGGYTDQSPNRIGQFLGQQRRPSFQAHPQNTAMIQEAIRQAMQQGGVPPGGVPAEPSDSSEQTAIQLLQQRGYPVTPENVQAVVQKLRQHGAGGS